MPTCPYAHMPICSSNATHVFKITFKSWTLCFSQPYFFDILKTIQNQKHTGEALLVQFLGLGLTLLLGTLLLNIEILWDCRAWVGFVMTEFNLITLGLTSIVQWMSTGVRFSLGTGILSNMLSDRTSCMVVAFVRSGRHDGWFDLCNFWIYSYKIELL